MLVGTLLWMSYWSPFGDTGKDLFLLVPHWGMPDVGFVGLLACWLRRFSAVQGCRSYARSLK